MSTRLDQWLCGPPTLPSIIGLAFCGVMFGREAAADRHRFEAALTRAEAAEAEIATLRVLLDDLDYATGTCTLPLAEAP